MSYGYSSTPTFMRYKRVWEILRGDNALKRKLSTNMMAVCRPDQTSEDMPVEVITVTNEIHERGHDAYSMEKPAVIKLAHQLLIANAPTQSLQVTSPPQKRMSMKTIEETLKERLNTLQSGIADCKQRIQEYENQKGDCLTALAALQAKRKVKPEPQDVDEPVPEEPVPEEPVLEKPVLPTKVVSFAEQMVRGVCKVNRAESVKNFEATVLDITRNAVKDVAFPLDRFMFTHNRKYEHDQITRSACHHRLLSMSNRKLIRFERGVVHRYEEAM